jgi:hypothetical protein
MEENEFSLASAFKTQQSNMDVLIVQPDIDLDLSQAGAAAAQVLHCPMVP